ncbi:MAG TPA: glycosyltransferase [Candidatus Eisenbacteria bacterium]|nr:glycosyltransferase [Candidatus Eisenbacteria bacterium]
MEGRHEARGRPQTHRGLVPVRSARPGGRRVLRRAALNDPYFALIVPTRGDAGKLRTLLPALAAQTFPRTRHEVLLSFDGTSPEPALAEEIATRGLRVVSNPRRGGPGAARNRAARDARGNYLAFTEDDCVPDPSWLERAAARLEREPSIDVLAGATLLPDGSPARRPDRDQPHYLPTNLFVKRTVFEAVGGYDEGYFHAASGIYFREDSDFGFSLERAGARIALEPEARVVHPREHSGYLDPIRWARRYRMDARLRKRHPDRFRERIEVHRLGPFTVRRPFVRACSAVVIASLAAGIALATGEPGLASLMGAVALAAFLPVWAKWRFDPIRLPVILAVPFVLITELLRGAAAERSPRSPGGPSIR